MKTSATTLDLSRLGLRSVPASISQLANLTVLDLSANQLSSIPKELGQLANLTRLYLNENQLSSMPKELGQLANLTRLYLSENQLSSMPKELGQLANLTRLDLRTNQLSSMPKELGQLANLRWLDLRVNKLSSVPKELGQLANLVELYLSANQLSSVPKELGQLANLKVLDLSANFGLKSPPPEVLAQGTQAILSYLRSQISDGERQWISKLLVVGEGGVGKTSLLRALRRESFETQQSSTHGIEIKILNLAHPKETDVAMTLNTWDFGGQEIYHATHQFFLTNRSLFLLAFNARLGFEQGKLIYWLKTIRANAPESPVILVATWSDERDADLPLADLKEQFPQIVTLYEVSNKTGKGIRELRQAITNAAAELPLMGEIWPTTWLTFANRIRQIKAQQATPKQFWDAMTKCKISDEAKPVLATWLHELGDILFFQDDDDVNDLVILKPQWVTEYISKVLTAEEVINRNGIFTRQCMDQVWVDLTPSLRNFFLRLMERFDLSYRTLENRDISLVVERLPFELPDFQSLWQKKQQEPNCKEVSMKFQVSEILPGIPTWFIARQHRVTIDQGERRGIHWRTGVLFRDRDRKHLGLVRTLRDDSTNADYLHLTVRGPVPHNFFDVLREGLELTLRRYPGLKITRLLPCPDPAQTTCLHEFDYANLTMRLERTPPRETIECPNCLENISVTRLLFGLHYTTQDAVIAKIDELQDATQEGFDTLKDSMEQGFTELRELVQRDVLREIRTVQKQLESPCPSVFVLRPDERPVWQKDIGSQRINLQLYCEHPGCLHPVKDGGLYAIDNPETWLRVMAPHLTRLFGILKYVTPVVGPWVNLSAPIYSELVKNDLALTSALVGKLPAIKFTKDDRSFIDPDEDMGRDRKTRKISGTALRTLHEFLKRKDPDRVWGNLTRTTTPEGDVLWLCKEHIKEIYPTSS
ncbi:MAG: COR domain-containing protein [Cyanobacteria bacterium P01_A01_bin.114]